MGIQQRASDGTEAALFEPMVSVVRPSPSAQQDHVANATYFPWFDWLRFALALVVILSHSDVMPAQSGDFAVHVFFALSGWLVGGILLGTRPADLPRFYFYRAIRIWSPYYLALLFLVAASLLREPVTAKWLEFVAYKATFVWNLFGMQQLATFKDAMPLRGTGNHFWSVNAEEQFYLLAPMLLVVAAPQFGRRPLTWFAVAMVTCVVGNYGAIALGVFAAVLHRGSPDFHLRPAVRAGLVVLLVATAALILNGFDYDTLAPFCALPIVLLLAVKGTQTRLGDLAGGLSYPLYLNHWIGGFIATVLLTPLGLRYSPVRVVMAVSLSVAISAALYRRVDRPLLARRGAMYTLARGRLVIATAIGMIVIGSAFGLWMMLH